MSKKKYYLVRNQQYYFYILYNVHPETMSKLNYNHFGIKGMSIENSEFKAFVDEISGLREGLKEYLEELHHISGEKISYLLYSKSEDNLAKFTSFLTILRASRFFLWISFETHPEEFAEFEPKARNIMSVFSEWEKLFTLYEKKKKGDLFFLMNEDIVFTNKLIRNYDRLYNSNKSFPDLLTLYVRAYSEDNFYFKYLLLFMVIERLITDDDKNGINYKIRRMCAVLIGEDIERCQSIYKGASDAYSLRSKLVHSAKFSIEHSYLIYVHSMVCEILLLLLVAGIKENDIFFIATQMGYGQRDTLIKEKLFKNFGPLNINSINLIYPFTLPDNKKHSSKKKK